MRRILLALGLAAAPFVPTSSVRAAASVPVPFTILAQPAFSGWTGGQADIFVIRKVQWERLWLEHAGPGSPAPAVNFATENVLAMFAGMKPTGGFIVDVTAVTTDGSQVDVFVDDISPGPTCNVIQVLTNPCEFVKIPKLGLPVVFHHNSVVTSCP